jgi:hypothetical protein
LMFHLPVKAAVAASVVSVIATSNAGGSSYGEANHESETGHVLGDCYDGSARSPASCWRSTCSNG